MANTDTAGAIGALSRGISGFTEGYMGARQLRMRERESEAQNARAQQEFDIRRQALSLDKDRASMQLEEAKNQQRISSLGDAFKALSLGNKPLALQLANQDRSAGTKIIDMNIDPNTGDWNRVLENNQVEKLPFDQVAPYIPEFNQLMRSRYSGYGADNMIRDPYAEAEGLEEINEYFNVDPKNDDNPQGISATTRRGVIEGLQKGIDFATIGKSLGLKRRGESADALKAAVASAKEKLNMVQKRATAGKGLMTDLELKQVKDSQADLRVALQELERATGQQPDLGSMRYSGVSGRRMPVIGGAVQQAPQQPAPVPMGQPAVAAQQPGQTVNPWGAPAQAQAGANMQQLDSNRDGRLDERDEMVRMALLAEQNADVLTQRNPQLLEQAKAILKVYRGQLQKQSQRAMMQPRGAIGG